MREQMAKLTEEKVAAQNQLQAADDALADEKKHVQDLIAELALSSKKSGTKKKRAEATAQRSETLRGKFDRTMKEDEAANQSMRMKDTLASMASERLDFEEALKKEHKKRKEHEQSIQILGGKINFLEMEVAEAKAHCAKLTGEKEVVGSELKSQREQNLTLHKRLGEIFDPNSGDDEHAAMAAADLAKERAKVRASEASAKEGSSTSVGAVPPVRASARAGE
jgi:chromosome segregation ATPase